MTLQNQIHFPTTFRTNELSNIIQHKIKRGPQQSSEFNSDNEQSRLTFFRHPGDVKISEAIMKEGLEGVVEFLLPELAFAGEQGESNIPSLSTFISCDSEGVQVHISLTSCNRTIRGQFY